MMSSWKCRPLASNMRSSKVEGAHVSCRGHLSWLNEIRTKLDKENLAKFKSSCFGHLLDISNMQFQGQLVYLLLCHLDKESLEKHCLSFVINNQHLEFGRSEFFYITGLQFKAWQRPPNSSKIHSCIFKDKPDLKLVDIHKAFLNECKNTGGRGELALKLALLYALFGILLVRDRKSKKIELQYLHVVDDLDTFNNFGWGHVVYDFLVAVSHSARNNIDNLKNKGSKPSFDACGFSYALQVWTYEVMPKIAELCAVKVVGSGSKFPRMLHWSATHYFHYNALADIFSQNQEDLVVPMDVSDKELLLLASVCNASTQPRSSTLAVVKMPQLKSKIRRRLFDDDDDDDGLKNKKFNSMRASPCGINGSNQDVLRPQQRQIRLKSGQHPMIYPSNSTSYHRDPLPNDAPSEAEKQSSNTLSSVDVLSFLNVIVNKLENVEKFLVNVDYKFHSLPYAYQTEVPVNVTQHVEDPRIKTPLGTHSQSPMDKTCGGKPETIGGKFDEGSNVKRSMLSTHGEQSVTSSIEKKDRVDGSLGPLIFSQSLPTIDNPQLPENLRLNSYAKYPFNGQSEHKDFVLSTPSEFIDFTSPSVLFPPSQTTMPLMTIPDSCTSRIPLNEININMPLVDTMEVISAFSAEPGKTLVQQHAAWATVESAFSSEPSKTLVQKPATETIVGRFDPCRPYTQKRIDEFEAWYNKACVSKKPVFVHLPIEILTRVSANWFAELWQQDGLLSDDHCDALINLIILKSKLKPFEFLHDWTMMESLAWQTITQDNIEAVADKIFPYIQGKYPQQGGLAWWQINKIFGIGHVKHDHWVAYEVDIPTQTITVYDSLSTLMKPNPVYEAFENVRRNIPWLIDKLDVWRRKDLNYNLRSYWDLVRYEHAPQQSNGADCGVMAIKYIECLASGQSVNIIHPYECGQYRKYFCAQLYHGGKDKENM